MIQDIFSAIRAYPKAFRTISDLRLWSYFLVPGMLSLLIGFGVYYGADSFANRFDDWIVNWYPWEWGKSILETASYWIGLIVVWGGALIVYKHLILILASPFMSPLAQKVENELLGGIENAKPFSITKAIQDLLRGLRIALRNITRELFFTLLLMLLSLLIPIIGPFISVLLFLIQAYYAGFGNMDFTMERHFGVSGAARFVKQNRGLAIGNGIVFMGLLFTGIGVLIAPPLATVAAALQTLPRIK